MPQGLGPEAEAWGQADWESVGAVLEWGVPELEWASGRTERHAAFI